MLLIFINLVLAELLSCKVTVMHNFVAKFGKILEICKQFAENQVNEKENVTRCAVAPTFFDLEVMVLSITAEVFSIDIENCTGTRIFFDIFFCSYKFFFVHLTIICRKASEKDDF